MDKTVRIAEKIALYDRKVWPKAGYDREVIADEHRLAGNYFYTALDFQKAILYYNRTITLTKLVEKMGIAYSNRSAAYYALKSYRDCLGSVRLAKECPLPTSVWKKLVERERMAIDKLESAPPKETNEFHKTIELSYRRHKRITSFVHCLSLKDHRNLYGGIVTTKNFLPGDVLVVEKPLTAHTFNICAYCLRESGSLQPCKCNFVMFCSQKCKEDAFATFHQIECPLMDYLSCFALADQLVQRIFFKLMFRFKDVPRLRQYMESIKNPNPFDLKDAEDWPEMDSFESQFRIYFSTKQTPVVNAIVRKPLSSAFENPIVQKYLAHTAVIIDLLKTCKGVPQIAKTQDEWSFLSEQLFQMFCLSPFTSKLTAFNEISYIHTSNGEVNMQVIPTDIGATALYGTASLFKSSCRENIAMDYVNGVLVVRALKFIPKKSELLCSAA